MVLFIAQNVPRHGVHLLACLSWCIVWNRLNISSNFFHCPVAPALEFICMKCFGEILMVGALNRGIECRQIQVGHKKIAFFHQYLALSGNDVGQGLSDCETPVGTHMQSNNP